MKLFSKKDSGNSKAEKEEHFFTVLENNPDKNRPKPKTRPQHVLTPDEVIAGFENKKPANVKSTGALDSLKKRLTAAANNNNDPESLADKVEENSDFTDIMPKAQNKTSSSEEDAEIKMEKPEVKEEKTEAEMVPKMAETPPETEVAPDAKKEAEPIVFTKPSLFDKCNAYIKDDEGKNADPDAEPPYKLQSVAEILQNNSDETLKMLSDRYNISFDDLGRTPKPSAPKVAAPVPKVPAVAVPTKAAEKTTLNDKVEEYLKKPMPQSQNSVGDENNQVFEETISFRNVQSSVKSIISDIDAPYLTTTVTTAKNIHDTATITFTPVGDKVKGSAGINVSSKTRPIDLTGEIAQLPQVDPEPKTVQLEKNEFEDYIPKEEFDYGKNANRLIRKYSIRKRNYFLTTTVSILLTILLSFTQFRFMSQLILAHTRTSMILFTAMTALIVLVNGNMFISLRNILNRRGNADICASLASLATLGYAVMGIVRQAVVSDMLLLLAIMLSFRSLTAYYKTSYMLSNMKFIRGNNPKNAVKLINDNAVTFAMSKNSIEGDVLIAAPQKTTNVSDFMKYSTFGSFLGGLLPILTIISVILSIIFAFTFTFYFDGLIYGLYAVAAIQCFASLPMVFYIDILPIYRANKKLRSRGGIILSKTAADHIENSNAIVIESADLFPAGRITLHQMKVLSENDLDDTIIRAASLTENMGSSLAPIFKQIAGTGNVTVLPDSDTVKYEDRMGISGWVDNRLLFIGNRTLMEAHGIEVPSVEIDRKILREGYFPVYVATREKACALLIIQYHVDREIAKELRALTALGVTLLVNSCDPNLIEEMICDYFGLYSDSVKVMSAAGCHMYKNTVTPAKTVSAPAVYRSNPLALATILNCASKIKKSNTLLTVMYVLSAVLGTVIFAYASLGGSGNLIHQSTLLVYGVLSTAATYLFYLFARP